jgi:hypothetical protein
VAYKYGHTTSFQLRAMTEWLEVPDNYKIMHMKRGNERGK